MSDIDRACESQRRGAITQRQLSHWAAFVLLGNFFVWPDEENTAIGDRLNELSLMDEQEPN